MSKLEDFINIGISKRGWGFEAFASWAKTLGVTATRGAWCAEFICACAKEAGILDTLIYRTPIAYNCCDLTAKLLGGTRFNIGEQDPQPGDLIYYKYSHIEYVHEYDASTREMKVIGGNTGSGVVKACESRALYNYGYWSNQVSFFVRPNWQLTGDGSGSSLWGDLYSMRNTREDAIVREVLYEDNNKVVPYYTRDKISVGNYTDVFAELWDWGKILLQPLYNLDGVEGSARIVIQFFMDKGCEPAAGCGVAGNIKQESGFNTSSYAYDPDELGNPGWSSGICQWRAGRGEAMRRFVGDNWKNDLSGQLEYLWHELETSYTAVKNHLLSVKNNEEGVRSSTDIFVRQFERPANPSDQSQKRQVFAMEYFNTIVPMIATSNKGIGHPLGVNF